MGGSILPATIHNNKIYFLFGKERDIDENPGWSDFGGGQDHGESPKETAIREGVEEFTGFLGNQSDIRTMLNKYGTYTVQFKSPGFSSYVSHIFPMKYDPYLTEYYNNNQKFLQKKLDPKIIKNMKIFEKTKIKWFSWSDIKKHRSEFRSFYRNIIDQLLEHKTEINNFIRKSLTSSLSNKYNKSKKYSTKRKSIRQNKKKTMKKTTHY